MNKKTACLAFLLAFAALPVTLPGVRAAEPPEKTSLAIGTASFGLTYLPVIIAERKGYFKQEGLSVEISAFAGGSKALEALLGGSLDVVSGAYSNTLTMAARKQKLVAFVQQIRCPGFSVLVSKRKAAAYMAARDMKGWNVGVSAPGSSTNMVLNYILSKGWAGADRRLHHRGGHLGRGGRGHAGGFDRRDHQQ